MNVNKLAEKIINETNRKDYQHVVYEVVDYLYLNGYLEDRASLLKKQSKQEQINAMLDVLEDISKFPYSPSQLVPWNHILVEINKKITEIKALNAPEPKGMPDKVREWDFTKSAPDE